MFVTRSAQLRHDTLPYFNPVEEAHGKWYLDLAVESMGLVDVNIQDQELGLNKKWSRASFLTKQAASGSQDCILPVHRWLAM